MTFPQEADKVSRRIPAARAYITEHKLNETVKGDIEGVGIILQGGIYNTVIRQLAEAGLSDAFPSTWASDRRGSSWLGCSRIRPFCWF